MLALMHASLGCVCRCVSCLCFLRLCVFRACMHSMYRMCCVCAHTLRVPMVARARASMAPSPHAHAWPPSALAHEPHVKRSELALCPAAAASPAPITYRHQYSLCVTRTCTRANTPSHAQIPLCSHLYDMLTPHAHTIPRAHPAAQHLPRTGNPTRNCAHTTNSHLLSLCVIHTRMHAHTHIHTCTRACAQPTQHAHLYSLGQLGREQG